MFGLDAYWTSILTLACIYAIAAVGLQLILSSGQFSVMQAAIMACGGYASANAELNGHLSFVWALLVGVAVAAALGLVTAVVLIRLSGLFFAIATLAVGQALYYLVQVVPDLGGPAGLSGVLLTTTPHLVLIILLVIVTIYLLIRRRVSYLRILATGTDAVAAEALGMDPWLIRIGVFTIGSALAGLAGGLYVHYVGLIQPPDLSFGAESQLLIYVVVGGVYTPLGAVAGTLGITVLLEELRVSSEDRYWILGAILVAVTLLRPYGILRRRRIRALPRWRPAFGRFGAGS